MTRFVRQNKKFISALVGAGVVAFILLVIAVWGYVEVLSANSEANDRREDIRQLVRRKPSPVEENRQPIQKDIATYTKATQALWQSFGHPYQLAADRFLVVLLGLSESDDLAEKKADFLRKYHDEVEESRNPAAAFDQFRSRYPRWGAATAEFIALAREIAPDPHIDSYADRMALAALGIPNELNGNADMMQDFMDKCRQRFAALMPEKIRPEAINFGLAPAVVGSYKTSDYRYLVSHLDIIGDIAKRIAQSPVDAFTGFVVRGGIPSSGAGREDAAGLETSFATEGKLSVAHYTFEVTGSLDAIRDLAKRFEQAAADRRIYVIRSIFIYISDEDDAKALRVLKPSAVKEKPAAAEPERTTSRGSRRRRSTNTESADARVTREQEMERRRKELEATLPMQQRTGYGEVLLGGNKECRAVFDIDYYIHEER